jgi:hypothetical protein
MSESELPMWQRWAQFRFSVNQAPFQPTADPLPALLRKWMADYASTGLPPAYLPKEELNHE